MKKLKIGIIGLGGRGRGLSINIVDMDDVEVVAVCDEYEDRVEHMQNYVKEHMGNTPIGTKDYKEVLAIDEIEAVIISTSWEAHVEIAVAAMRAGKYVGMEVGGAYAIEDCWKLVRTSEETGVPCMLLENCCYGQMEMMCLNLLDQGLLGEIVHCEGGYHHDLREEIINGNEKRHYRLRNYIMRCCENYPTHQLGPICKLLNINNGNRMVSLISVASKSASLREYAAKKRGADDPLANIQYAQGDVVTTIIRCAGGETITLTLDTTLPRVYSRGLIVSGTQGCYHEDNHSLYLDINEGKYTGDEFNGKAPGNAYECAELYNHPLWKQYLKDGVKYGHDGMDYLMLRAFFESVAAKVDPPIDVYDAAAWMSISSLSEDSIAMGGLPVPVPDFTSGKWIKPKAKKYVEKYRLDIIPEEID
ncbi:MAG: Gfo/Idh/MocA family oxidoreductase [Clostridia bacterium]|nr:Gfo/Idh/MocA family oxidoreductase [Clostridia bacterium]